MLGPHVIIPTDPSLRWARRASIVKQLDGTEALRVAPEDAWRVLRVYFPDPQPLDATVIVQAILTTLSGYRHPRLIVTLLNEAYQTLGEMQQYGPIIRQCVTALHAEGIKVAAPCFSTGNPDPATWTYCRAQGWFGVDLVEMHEYWGNELFTLQNALRHRTLWAPGDPPILIGECGRDAVEGGGPGWQRSGVTAEQYASELRAYAQALRNDPVIGATPFTCGPTPDWQSYDCDPLVDLLEETMSQDELERYCADIYKRANVPFNPNSAFYKYWHDQMKAGRFLGFPQESEHKTENGQYMVQAFASAILYASVHDWIVHEGLPPLA